MSSSIRKKFEKKRNKIIKQIEALEKLTPSLMTAPEKRPLAAFEDAVPATKNVLKKRPLAAFEDAVPATKNVLKKRPLIASEDASPATDSVSKKRTIKEPRLPTKSQLIYTTEHYKLYDVVKIEPVVGPFVSFGKYDDYRLYVNPVLDKIEDIPIVGVRLDDLTVSRVLGHLGPRALNRSWPAEFDQQGMVRATRIPLGLAAKMWVKAGKVDLDGKIVEEGAYYYKWWRGLHCLMGKEGFDAGMYKVRPSFETFRCAGFGFKVACKAVEQEPDEVSGALVRGRKSSLS